LILRGLKEETSLYTTEISAVMTIKYHVMGTSTLWSEEFCMVLSSNFTEVSVTIIISGIRIGSKA